MQLLAQSAGAVLSPLNVLIVGLGDTMRKCGRESGLQPEGAIILPFVDF